MAINITPEERNYRFKVTQLGRYLLAFFVIGLAFLLIFFSPGKDPAPYIGLAGTLIGGIVMFYFSKSTSNEKMPIDSTSLNGEDVVVPAMLPFMGNSPASNTPRICSTGELHAANCRCGDCDPVTASDYAEPVSQANAPIDYNTVMANIKAQAAADGIKYTTLYGAMNFKVWLFNNVPVGDPEFCDGLAFAKALADKAYVETVGAKPPTTYAEIANYNAYMNKLKKDTTNKYGCGKVPAETVRSVVMLERELLWYEDEYCS
jgi:hypothetical protein